MDRLYHWESFSSKNYPRLGAEQRPPIEFFKVFLIIQNSGAFDQDVLASGSRSNRNQVGFRLNLIAARKRKFEHGLII